MIAGSAVRSVAVVAGKDLRVEARGRHSVGVVAPFVGTLVIAFGLAVGPGVGVLRQTTPGLVWLAALFATVLAARRAYESESADDALAGLLLAPIDKSLVFLGKAAALAIQLFGLLAGVVCLIALLYGLPGPVSLAGLVPALVLGAAGLGAVGALLGAVAGSPRTRESVLPLLVFPCAAPVLVAAAAATGDALHDVTQPRWLSLLIAFNLIFWSLGVLLYAPTMED